MLRGNSTERQSAQCGIPPHGHLDLINEHAAGASLRKHLPSSGKISYHIQPLEEPMGHGDLITP